MGSDEQAGRDRQADGGLAGGGGVAGGDHHSVADPVSRADKIRLLWILFEPVLLFFLALTAGVAAVWWVTTR